MCQALDDGAAADELRDEILSGTDLTQTQAEALIVGSVAYYCPEFLPEEEEEDE